VLELINESNGDANNKIASFANMGDKDLYRISENLDNLMIKMMTTKKLNPENSPSKEPANFPARKRGQKQKRQLSSAATATRRGTCNKSATPGSARTPPCVYRNGKPLANQGKVATVDHKPDAELDA
jgi:hypothetical protein